MGVKATLRHSNVPHDAQPDSMVSDQDPPPGAKAACPTSSSRTLEKQSSQRRKVDSVLDDIMGDPDDFRDLADSDAESDGGRWEDAVRAALEDEEAEGGADHLEIQHFEDGLSKMSAEVRVKNGTTNTDCKHSLLIPSSAGDPGCSGQNGKGRLQKANESEGCKHSANAQTVSSGSQESRVYTRYFIIKSLNHHNIAKSIEKGIWATQAMNEPVLNEAFETSERVLLVFSVNMSGHFQGYARMTSPIGRRRANVWSEANEGANPWGGTFSVEWLRLHDLPFQKTLHLKNPLNFFKPVKISRDCQELTQEVGEALCVLIDEGADRDGRPKGKVTAADLSPFSLKRKRKEFLGVPNDGIQSRQQMGAGLNGEPRFAAVYPPLLPSGVAHDPFSSPRSIGRPPGGFSCQASYPPEGHRTSKSKSPNRLPDRGLDNEREDGRESKHRQRERSFKRDRPRDRTCSSIGHSADLAVEEDLLNMTYEEYLRRHGHSREFNNGYRQSGASLQYNSSSAGYAGGWLGRSAGLGFPEDQYSNYITSWYSRQGPPVGGETFYGSSGRGSSHPVTRPQDPHQFGQSGSNREPPAVKHADGKHGGSGYLDQTGRSSRNMGRITEAGS